MYPSEFDTGAPAYPAASDLFLSVPPVILLLFVLLLLLALLCGWYAREQMGPKPKDPCEAIHDDVRKAAEAALKASRDEVHARARTLLAVIDRRLGGIQALAEGVAGPCAVLREVLAPPPETRGERHGAGTGAKGERAADLVVVNNGKMVVHAGPGGSRHDRQDDPDAKTGTPDDPALLPDRRDEIERLRAAIHAFADHWRDRGARITDLRRARANLC